MQLPSVAYTPPGITTSMVYIQLLGIKFTSAAYAITRGHTQPSNTKSTHIVQIHLATINPLIAITTTITGHIPASPLETSKVMILLILVGFASSLASLTPLGKTPVNTSSVSSIPTSVNVFNILLSTTFVPPPTQPTGTILASIVVLTSIGHASLINHPQVITHTSTSSGRELSNLAEIYRDEAKYNGRNDSSIFKLANLWKNALNSLLKNFWMGSIGGRGLY